MVAMRDRLVIKAVSREGYSSLYRHLLSVRPEPEWRTTFGEREAILGYRLPDSARPHRPLWSSPKVGTGHSYPIVQQAAGPRTREAGIEAETLVFAYSAGTRMRPRKADRKRAFNLDRDFPPWDPGPWPEGFTVSREQIYDAMGRLTGGPEDVSGAGR